MGDHNHLKYMFLQGCWKARAGRLGLTIQMRPPTLGGHNVFVRTPFQVLLDSMENPLSPEFIHILVEDSGGP